jgi:predicted negative regulator of RcsB-dependent stress response
MATLDSDDANILDAETVNLRWVVYPIVAVVILVLGGFIYYYNQQNQRALLETDAREALMKSTTAEEMAKVADQFPGTDHASMALLSAGQTSFDKGDYDAAAKSYQRVVSGTDVDEQLRISARLGLAASLESAGKIDDAINAYLDAAHLGDKSPAAPYAYSSAARLYEQKNDKVNEIKTLTEASAIDSDSDFVKEAQNRLKELNAAATPPPSIFPTSTTISPSAQGNAGTNAAPAAPVVPGPAASPAVNAPPKRP